GIRFGVPSWDERNENQERRTRVRKETRRNHPDRSSGLSGFSLFDEARNARRDGLRWHPGRNNVFGDFLRHGQREHRKTRYRGERHQYYCRDKKREHQRCYPPPDGEENQRRRAKEMGWPSRHTHRRHFNPHAPREGFVSTVS